MKEYFDREETLLSDKVTIGLERPIRKKEESMDWKVLSGPNRLYKRFKFKKRSALMNFINDILEYEDEVQHHGKISITYKSVRIEIWTHSLEDVTESDYEYAKMVNFIYKDSND